MLSEDVVHTLYDRPTFLSLVGDIKDRRVLDLGCSIGSLTETFILRGAEVLGVDRDERAIAAARKYLGQRAGFEVADVSDGLGFVEESSIDVVTASLVFDYIEDWEPVLKSVKRVLKAEGRLVMSMHHPMWDLWHGNSIGSYFSVTKCDDRWTTREGDEVRRVTYRRPLGYVLDALRLSGLRTDILTEPKPLPALRNFRPDVFEQVSKVPWFLALRALNVPGEDLTTAEEVYSG